jgi:hypothetical protein
MRLLLDEDVPVQLVEPLRRMLPGHRVDHTAELGWKGKKDRFLLPDAAKRGYDLLLTNDRLNSTALRSAERSGTPGCTTCVITTTPDVASTGFHWQWVRCSQRSARSHGNSNRPTVSGLSRSSR